MKQENEQRQEWDAEFQQFKREHPGATFAEYSARRVSNWLAKGGEHRMLGTKVFTKSDGKKQAIPFAEAGRRPARAYRAMMGLEPHHRLIDYGCGSLRIGYHLMNYLDPGNYFGLDVTSDFIDIGKQQIGDSLALRRPQLAAIAPESLAAAKAFAADFVFSCAVALHVHPNETGTYYGNLQNLLWKPGSALFVSVRLSDKLEKYSGTCWSWPLDFYVKSLPELRFEEPQSGTGTDDRGEPKQSGWLKFVRPG